MNIDSITSENVNQYDKKGNTPLFYAAANQVEHLVKLGADVNHQNLKEETALFHADFDKAEKLIRAGADVNICSEGYATAIFFSDTKTTQLLINHGADVNQSDFEGDTPLSVAASYKDVDKGKILIENGANIHNVNLSTFTILELMPQDLKDFALEYEKKQAKKDKDFLEQETDFLVEDKNTHRMSVPKF